MITATQVQFTIDVSKLKPTQWPPAVSLASGQVP